MTDTDAPTAELETLAPVDPVSEPAVEPTPDAPDADTPETTDPVILEPAAPSQSPTEDAAPAAEVAAPAAQETVAPAEDPDVVLFRSTMPETNQFEVMSVYPRRDDTSRYLIWSMDAETAERFERHYFVTSGRIARVG